MRLLLALLLTFPVFGQTSFTLSEGQIPGRTSGSFSSSKSPTSIVTTPISVFHHYLITGQSNGGGAAAMPLLSTASFGKNWMFVTGVRSSGVGLTSLSELVESSQTDPTDGVTILGETVASSMARYMTNRTGLNYLFSDVATSGFRYTQLAKTTTPYNNSIAQVTAGKLLKPTGFRVDGVVNLHGETDQQFNVTTYAANLTTWQSDYETDIKAVTGQTGTIPMVVDQQNGYSPSQAGTLPSSTGPTYGSSTAYQAWRAYLTNPTKVVLEGPRYQYPYNPDGLHLTSQGQRWKGEMFAKAALSSSWSPLYPTSAILSANVITVIFNVPVPPIVLDYAMVFNPGNAGFEYFDAGTPPTITSVAITGPTTMTITLSGTPSGSNKQLRYGHTRSSTISAGPFTGARGNVRDSDASVSAYGYPLYNFCVQFVMFL